LRDGWEKLSIGGPFHPSHLTAHQATEVGARKHTKNLGNQWSIICTTISAADQVHKTGITVRLLLVSVLIETNLLKMTIKLVIIFLYVFYFNYIFFLFS